MFNNFNVFSANITHLDLLRTLDFEFKIYFCNIRTDWLLQSLQWITIITSVLRTSTVKTKYEETRVWLSALKYVNHQLKGCRSASVIAHLSFLLYVYNVVRLIIVMALSHNYKFITVVIQRNIFFITTCKLS